MEDGERESPCTYRSRETTNDSNYDDSCTLPSLVKEFYEIFRALDVCWIQCTYDDH
jgi:hypothetical protein